MAKYSTYTKRPVFVAAAFTYLRCYALNNAVLTTV